MTSSTHTYLLDIPFGTFAPKGVTYDRTKKVHFYKGAGLPEDLRHYSSEDFSYTRWLEDDMNGRVLPPKKGSSKFSPRDHQKDAARAIKRAYDTNWRGFLLADKTGLGKTLSTLVGLSVVAKAEGFTPKNKANVLIVCPKGVIPQWRHTLHNYPIATSLMRPMVLNYQQLNKLLHQPAAAKKAKKTKTKNRAVATNGKPKHKWDFVVFDEAHSLKNYPSSGTSLAACSVASLNKPYRKGQAPFVIFSTATPGASPLNFAVMAGIIAPLISNRPEAKKVTPDTWGDFLHQEGFAVKKGKFTWSWATNPWFGKDSDDPRERARYERAVAENKKVQRKDTQKIGRGLKKPNAPFIMRSPSDLAGWPEQQFIPTPLKMTPKQVPIYEEAWTTFRTWLRLTPAKSDPKGALVQMLRYRQKASLLKVEPMVDQVIDWVENGHQVFISVEFIETLERYKTELEKAGITVAEISGRNSADREDERLKFQKGEAKVVLCTVVAGISLHSNETLPDGTKATSTPRISVISDVRQNNLDTAQACGRGHRDGENSLTYFPYLEDTVDERVIFSFVNKQSNLNSMMGASQAEAEELERLFREAASQ